MPINVFVDDIRKGYEGDIILRSYDEFVEFMTKNKEPIDWLSLDHDLGLGKNGLDIVRWMIENLSADKWPKTIRVHSANPAGAMNMYLEIVGFGACNALLQPAFI